MKIKITLLSLIVPALLMSQIVIDQNDMPQPGDTIRLSSTVSFGTINYEETGNNFIWDFSSLLPITQKVDTFVDFDETPWIYQLVFWGSSNLAKELMGFDQYPGFQITDAYEYYKTSSSDFRLAGNAATLNGIPFPNKFDAPDVIYKFPLTPGNVDSSYSYYDIPLTGIGYAGGWKKRVNHVDGWGTLSTPFGTFPVIRVKSEVDQYDSIYIDTLGFGIPYQQNFIEYKWLGDGFGEPLCTFTENGPLVTVDYIDSVRNLIIGVYETETDGNPFSIFPNPAADFIHFTYRFDEPSIVQLSLFNLQGRKLADLCENLLVQGSGIRTFSIAHLNLNPGFYLMSVNINKSHYQHKFLKI